jgi:hypothetical protein
MRLSRWVVGTILIGATACAHAPRAPIAGGEPYRYPSRRDRHATVILFPVDGKCKVIGAPETHIAFPVQKVIWRVVNLCAPGTEIELVFDRRTPESAPANPFSESGGIESKDRFTFGERVRDRYAPENTFTRTVKPASAFPAGVEVRYFYKVGIKDDPSSFIEPEMDIWP